MDLQMKRSVKLMGNVTVPPYISMALRLTPDYFIPVSNLESIVYVDNPKNNDKTQPLGHTNDILDYLGFQDGEERANVLGKFGADYQAGANLVKTADHFARFFGLDRYNIPLEEKREIFLAIMKSIRQYGPLQTDSLIEQNGIEKLPELMKESYVIQRGGEIRLRQKGDLQTVLTNLGTFQLPSVARYLGGLKSKMSRGNVIVYISNTSNGVSH